MPRTVQEIKLVTIEAITRRERHEDGEDGGGHHEDPAIDRSQDGFSPRAPPSREAALFSADRGSLMAGSVVRVQRSPSDQA